MIFVAEKITQSLGERIKIARKRKKLTLKQLGSRIGRTDAALSQIENSVTQPERATLIALARELEDDFGDAELTNFAQSTANESKDTNIEDLSVEEFISLKFGIGKPEKLTKRRKDELMDLAKILDKALEEVAFDDE